MISLQSSFTKKQLIKSFKKVLLGKRLSCGYCKYGRVILCKSDKRYWCRKCRRKSSLKSLSLFKGSKLSWEKLYLLLELWLNEITAKQAVKLSRLSLRTVYRYYRLFRLKAPEINGKFNSDILVMDDSYFGGKRKGKRGRGAAGKTIVLGLRSKRQDQIKTLAVPDLYFKRIGAFISFSVSPDSSLISDSFPRYQEAADWLRFNNHFFIDHSIRFKETNPIENVWSVMKFKLRKIYHHATMKYMPEYIKELTYRFNARLEPDTPFTFLEKTLQLT